MGRSHPIIAAIYDRLRESEEIVGLAERTVVEVGVGTGFNRRTRAA